MLIDGAAGGGGGGGGVVDPPPQAESARAISAAAPLLTAIAVRFENIDSNATITSPTLTCSPFCQPIRAAKRQNRLGSPARADPIEFQLNLLAVEIIPEFARPHTGVFLMGVPLKRLLEHCVRAALVASGQHNFCERNTRLKLPGFKLYRA